MSLLPNTSDIPELSPVEPGEYDLRIIRVNEVTSKRTGREGVMFVCEIIGEDSADELLDTLWKPMETDDESYRKRSLRDFKERALALGLPDDGTPVAEDFADLEFSAKLGLEDDDVFGRRNTIVKIL